MSRGLIHLYIGDGKGKTTAAMGLALRAAGRGMPVGIAQFLKDGSSGECRLLKDLPGITLFPFLPEVPFTFVMTPEQKAEAGRFYTALLEQVARRRELELVILDEALDAANAGLLSGEALPAFLRNRPSGQEVVLTGRNPPDVLLGMADYITEMRAVRHPFERGQPARRGIEW